MSSRVIKGLAGLYPGLTKGGGGVVNWPGGGG